MLRGTQIRKAFSSGHRSPGLVLLVLALLFGCSPGARPRAVAGVMDLRHADLETTVVPLDGQWQFHWGNFVAPDAHTAGQGVLPEPPTKAGPNFIAVPNVWNGVHSGSVVIPGTGYGTYRLRVLLPERFPKQLALHVREIGTAYRMFANGHEVHRSGTVAGTAASARPDYRTGVVPLRTEGTTLDLVVHVSNFENKWGGMWHSVGLGSDAIIRRSRDRRLMAELGMSGFLLALGTYHLILFLFRPQGRSPLFFGLFCIAVSLRTVLTGERALIGVLSSYDWEWLYRLEYLSFYLSLPAWLAYVGSLYPHLISRTVIRLLLLCTVPFIIMVLFTRVILYAEYLWLFQILTLLSGLYTTYVSARAIRAAEVGAVAFLVGWLVLFVAVIVDIVAAQGLVPTVNLVPGCFIFFVVSQSTILAQRFSRAFATAELLTEEMDRRVRNRTMELARAKDEAEQSSRAKSEFLSVMSHELRTPMHGILGAADLLVESRITEEQHGYVRLLKRSGMRMMKLIGEVLDMARIEAGRVEIGATEFSIRELLEQSLIALGVRARAKDIELLISVHEDVPAVLVGDPERLEQILLNLVGNALKFSEGGTVAVHIAPDSPGREDVVLSFSVSDSGPGIPDALLARLFRPFTQGDSSSTRRHGGTGLGLAISRGLVELMGGQIGCRNLPEGGAEFRFTAHFGRPGEPDSQPVAASAAAGPQHGPDLAGLRLLVAEDDEDNVLLIQHFLRGTGVDAVVVVDGRRAVEAAQSERFDVLLLDIQMPILDGLEAAREIRKRERALGLLPVPILALSAAAMAHDVERSLSAGFTAHLSKPVSRAALLKALADAKAAHLPET